VVGVGVGCGTVELLGILVLVLEQFTVVGFGTLVGFGTTVWTEAVGGLCTNTVIIGCTAVTGG